MNEINPNNFIKTNNIEITDKKKVTSSSKDNHQCKVSRPIIHRKLKTTNIFDEDETTVSKIEKLEVQTKLTIKEAELSNLAVFSKSTNVKKSKNPYFLFKKQKKNIEQHVLSERLSLISTQKGYLSIANNELCLVDDLLIAKENQGLVENYFSQVEGLADPKILQKLKLRFMDEQIQSATHVMPASTLNEFFETHKTNHGIYSALKLLEQIGDQKIANKQRYTAVDPWPTRKESTFLHVNPNVVSIGPPPQPVAKTGSGKPSVLLNMMEPSLESSITIGGMTFSNAKLLIIDKRLLQELIDGMPKEIQREIINHKNHLDSFYKNKASFKYSYKTVEGQIRTLVITMPTSRYVPNQFLVLSQTDRKDLLLTANDPTRAEKFISKSSEGTGSLKRSSSVASFSTEAFDLDAIEEMIEDIEVSINPHLLKSNQNDIESIANLLTELEPNSLIGQNAYDASTDANYQHLQVFIDAPSELIPCFNAPSEPKFETNYKDEKGEKINLKCEKIRPESFPGTIYKISTTKNNKEIISCLKALQNDFLRAENNGSSLNLIGRKTEAGYEYYFVLRKSIDVHPHLQKACVKAGTTRPGWAEMIGIRIGKEDFFQKIPDEDYEKILRTFQVERKECVIFEDIAKSEIRKLGPINFNLVETHLRALRSDAETSQMYHCVKLSGASPEQSIHFVLNAPEEMQPNIFITPHFVNEFRLDFNGLSEEIGHQMIIRKAHEKNYGVIAIDANVVALLPEFKILQEHMEEYKSEYFLDSSINKISFKSFLLKKNSENPSVVLFLTYLSDADIDIFLNNPPLFSEINIHQALIRRAAYHMDRLCKPGNSDKLMRMGFTSKQLEAIIEYAPPNIRTEEYEYGNTSLIHSQGEWSIADYEERQKKNLLLGGNKFNTHPANSIVNRVNQEGLKSRFYLLLNRTLFNNNQDYELALKETIINTAALIEEIFQPRSVGNINKATQLLDELIQETNSSPYLDYKIPQNFSSEVKRELSLQVALRMVPIFAQKKEMYSLAQLSYNTDQIPRQFQSDGKFVPCNFVNYTTPDLTSVCCETVPFRAPVMPTGKKIAIVMNGGQASGVADVAAGALLIAGPENEMHVFIHGNDGLLRGDSINASLEDLDLIRSQGGFPGGTTRTPLLTQKDKEIVKKNIQDYDGVIFIGGDGSYRSNKDVFLSTGVPVYFCIKTIDGDFQVEDTDFTLGYYTAIEGYGEMIEERNLKARNNHEMHILQVGGRYAGFLAVGTSALLPESARPNLCIYPEEIVEKKWSFSHVIEIMSKTIAYRMAEGKPYAVFSLAEGTIQELPEVKALIAKIKEIKMKFPQVKDDQLKEFLKIELFDLPNENPNQLSLYETLLAFSDEDIKLLGKPDPIGRVPLAQIDSYAAFGRLITKRLEAYKKDPDKFFVRADEKIQLDQNVLENSKLILTNDQLDKFLNMPVPAFKGTKSNYDQRSRPAIKEDYNNGLLQGMTAASAALFGLKIEGQTSAIIATSKGRKNIVAISTNVKAGGEYIQSNHEYVHARNLNLQTDLNK